MLPEKSILFHLPKKILLIFTSLKINLKTINKNTQQQKITKVKMKT